MAVAGMAAVAEAAFMAAVGVVGSMVEVGATTVAEAGVTLISMVAGVLTAVQAERRRARFQGRALMGIAPMARGRTA